MSRGFACVAALIGLLCGADLGRAADGSAAEQAAAGVGKLAWNLVRAAGEGNVILSPVSVWEALAMTHAGARGDTAAEIADVLGMPNDGEVIGAAAAALRNALAGARSDAITLDVANRLWVQRGKQLETPFTAVLEKRFGAGAGVVDFATAAEAARKEINAWVSERTAHKIDELMKPDTIDALTRLVLTNAVFMKAAWEEPFEKSATQAAPFTLAGGMSVAVPFMNRSGQMRAGKVGGGDGAATVCEIPYDGPLAMVIVVPEKLDGLEAVVGELGGDWRTGWSAEGEFGVRSRKVVLSLPRWKARQPLSLKEPLMAMGMEKAFAAGQADFSGIDGTKDLFVATVVHEGFVEVSEEGTEAAAATGVAIGVRSMRPRPEEPLVVKADRPFAWAVVERNTGVMLFAGVVTDPR